MEAARPHATRRVPTPGRPRRHRVALALALGAAAVGAPASGCFTAQGLEPPLDSFYFPTGLAASPGGTVLYVANSDFDLQYNGGTVQALDLAGIRARALALATSLGGTPGAEAACIENGLARNLDTVLNPGPCAPLPASGFIRAAVTIGAFASDAVLVHRPDAAGARLFVPVRGDPSVTFFDVSDDRDPSAPTPTCDAGPFCLLCDVGGTDLRCGARHRVGESPLDNDRQLRLPAEPVGIAASGSGEALVVTHQTDRSTSLLVNTWNERPALRFILGDLGDGPTEVVAVPVPAYVTAAAGAVAYQPGFLVTFRASAQLALLRYQADAGSAPPRPFLTRAQTLPITQLAGGVDSRGIALDTSQRLLCEADCAAEDLSCLRECATLVPHRLFLVNRDPASLLVGEVRTHFSYRDGQETPDSASETVSIRDTVPLSVGASRVELGQVVDRDGVLRRRVFAVTFDSRLIFSYDPEARRIDAVIRTGRGPHALTFDSGVRDGEAYSLMIVGHFTDSYLGVVDLDVRRQATFGSMILSLGTPRPPREAQ